MLNVEDKYKFELQIFQNKIDIQQESINLQKTINKVFNGNKGGLGEDFVKYINDLVQQEIQQKTLINRLNQILQAQENIVRISESFKRQEIYTLLLMMYFNLIDSNFKKRGFYLTNMEKFKHSKYSKAQEKHKCLLYYFKIFYEINRDNQDQVTFVRDFTDYSEIEEMEKLNEKNMVQDYEVREGLIQDVNKGNVIVDFADLNVGGLVLDGANCAQEEVILLSYPEGIISMLFMRPIEDNEAIFIQNAIRYNNYTGYENTFKQQVLNIEKKEEFIIHHILMIDARQYFNPQQQFKLLEKQREIQKCYTGFKIALNCQKDQETIISTGKWGCGIFNGDLQLKFLIQLYGFSLAKLALGLKNKSSIKFSSFNDKNYLNMMKNYNLKGKMSAIQKIIMSKND